MNKKILLLINVCLLLTVILVEGQTPLYNTTNLSSAENFYEQAVALNDITEGGIGISFLLVIFIVTFIIVVINTNDLLSGLAATGWITAFTATIFLPLNFIDFWIYEFVLILCAVAIFLSFMFKRFLGN